MPHKLGQVLKHQTSYKNLVLIFVLHYPSFMLSLDAILSPVFMVRVSVKHMMLGLKVKGKMISLMFSSSLGKAYRWNIWSHWHTREFDVAAKWVESWHTRCYSTWHNSKSLQITTWAYYHQARKHYTNIFIVLLIKLGICEDRQGVI